MVEIRYQKPKRFPLKGCKVIKNTLKEDEVKKLLSGKVVVEEKMDGKPVSFETSEYIIFAEDMKKQHSIFYVLPGRYAIFDIYDKKRRVFVFSDEKLELSNAFREGKLQVDGISPALFFPVPVIATGILRMEDLPKLIGLSAYACIKKTREKTLMEGIVVKPYRDLFPKEFLSGKLVRTEFEKGIRTHYLRMHPQYNIIDPSVRVIEFLPSLFV
ncbi:MAG: RNA ligase family protein [Candidatus Bilamarchaeaceae archaeon]